MSSLHPLFQHFFPFVLVKHVQCAKNSLASGSPYINQIIYICNLCKYHNKLDNFGPFIFFFVGLVSTPLSLQKLIKSWYIGIVILLLYCFIQSVTLNTIHSLALYKAKQQGLTLTKQISKIISNNQDKYNAHQILKWFKFDMCKKELSMQWFFFFSVFQNSGKWTVVYVDAAEDIRPAA